MGTGVLDLAPSCFQFHYFGLSDVQHFLGLILWSNNIFRSEVQNKTLRWHTDYQKCLFYFFVLISRTTTYPCELDSYNAYFAFIMLHMTRNTFVPWKLRTSSPCLINPNKTPTCGVRYVRHFLLVKQTKLPKALSHPMRLLGAKKIRQRPNGAQNSAHTWRWICFLVLTFIFEISTYLDSSKEIHSCFQFSKCLKSYTFCNILIIRYNVLGSVHKLTL